MAILTNKEVIEITYNGTALPMPTGGDIHNARIENYLVEAGVLPSGYTQLESIQSTGTQHINTLFNANNNTSIEITANIPPASSNGFLYRCGTTWGTNTYALYLGADNQTRYKYGSVSTSAFSFIIPNAIHTYKQEKNIFYRDNAQILSISSNTFTCGNNLMLLSSTDLNEKLSATVYHCKIWDNGTLARDFYPAKRDSDSAIGLYDIVNNSFYANAGTGAFVAGGEIPYQTTIAENTFVQFSNGKIIESTNAINGVTKTECTSTVAGQVYVLDV